jgi:hypothetical protein
MMLGQALVITLLTLSGTGTADDLLRDKKGVAGGGLEPLRFTTTTWNPDRIAFTFTGPQDTQVVVSLTRHATDAKAVHRLSRYNVHVDVKPSRLRNQLKDAIKRVVERIRKNETRGPPLRPLKRQSHTRSDTGVKPASQSASSVHKKVPGTSVPSGLSLWICFGLMVLMLFSLPFLIEEVVKTIGMGTSRIRILVFLATALVIAIQLLVPSQLVTVFAGYGSVAEAYAFQPVLKYGAATTALYGPLLHLYPASIQVIVAANTILGLMGAFCLVALAVRLAGSARGWTTILAVLLIGLAPVLLRDRATESVLVPVQFWIAACLVHLHVYLNSARSLHLLGALVHGALALHGRPEAFLILPILAGAVLVLPRQGTGIPRKHLLMAGALLVLLALPRIITLIEFISHASRSGDVPGLATGDIDGFWAAFQHKNSLWIPEIFNPVVVIIALIAPFIVERKRRWSLVMVWLAIILWQALSTLDLPDVSISRVQAPALSWVLMLATIPFLMTQNKKPFWQRWSVVAACIAMIPVGLSVGALWAPTNAQAFDRFWQNALPQLPVTKKKRCVVALSMSDPPRDIVTRLYPLTSIAIRSNGLESYGISTFLADPGASQRSGCEPLYLVGPQCYARFFGFEGRRPARIEEHPLCRRMREAVTLHPIYEARFLNTGNADFPFYGVSSTLTYGLYRPEPLK